jgi:hypothetical protein
VLAFFVTMPKATMYENDGQSFGEYNVRLAREVLPMQTEAKPRAMQYGANHNLRDSVAPFNPSHIPTASVPIEPVHPVFPLS